MLSCRPNPNFIALERSPFMLRSGWFLLLALPLSGLVVPALVQAAEPKVNDQAEFFSKSAVEQATRKIQEINRRFKVEVVIETFPAIPDSMKAKYKPEEKKQFFRHWAETRAADAGVKGIYVLICKNPGHLQVAPDQAIRKKAFTLEQRDSLVKSAVKSLGQKQYDAALSEMVETVASTLQTNLSR
jgi:uncharacterized membrane protein YgcG